MAANHQHPPIERALWRTITLAVALALAVVALIGVVVELSGQTNLAKCVNNNLLVRSGPNAQISKATQDFYANLLPVLQEPDPNQRGKDFASALSGLNKTIASAQIVLDAHPIGRC